MASIGATCNISLNEQGLLAGLVAQVPGTGTRSRSSAVENACASGGQAVLSVIQKLQCGLGEIGIAVGYEKMRDAEGKMDGKLIGKVLGYFSHPDERPGKVFVFPHLFAEVMDAYMKAHGYTERAPRRDRGARSTRTRSTTPTPRCATSDLTLEQAVPDRGRSTATSWTACAQDLRLLADHATATPP